MKFVKSCLRLLLSIRLELLSLKMAKFIKKGYKKSPKKVATFFPYFLETENLLNENVGLAKVNSLRRPQKQTKAAEMRYSSFGLSISLILYWSQLDHF